MPKDGSGAYQAAGVKQKLKSVYIKKGMPYNCTYLVENPTRILRDQNLS